jgi:AcrR family transcriptional regulator
MTEATRRERLRAATERDIRQQARTLLVEHGREAVTLRAIARELGITAPALYRYYDSREDLLRHLCDDICTDLGAELEASLAGLDKSEVAPQVFAVCRAFRHWALAHPREFNLVFASTEDTVGQCIGGSHPNHVGDQFGRVFLEIAGRLIASHPVRKGYDDNVPESVRKDLIAFQQVLLVTVRERGVPVTEEILHLGTIYHIVQSWVRIYGHVALEVFGHFPFAVSNPEPMFDMMLAGMIAEIGFDG